MKIIEWDKLPDSIRIPEVRMYYEALSNKSLELTCKRIFDLIVTILMIVVLLPVFLIISAAIKIDSEGPVFYRQVRITQYGREFRIFKFRTMVNDADKNGTFITFEHDTRVTKLGQILRKTKLDEIPQLFNIILGDMSFVGTRPEVPKYVQHYTPEMMATLLLPAGITSLASIYYKDENSLINSSDDIDKVYLEKILPAKMKWNIEGILTYSFWNDIKIMFMTFLAVCGKNYGLKDKPISIRKKLRRLIILIVGGGGR